MNISVKRGFGGLLGVALAAVLAAGAARAEIKTEWIDYKQGDTALRGFLAYDDAIKDKRPGVLLVHRRDGMSALTLKNAGHQFPRKNIVAPDGRGDSTEWPIVFRSAWRFLGDDPF